MNEKNFNDNSIYNKIMKEILGKNVQISVNTNNILHLW